jgi:hypothetical protein
MARKSKINKPPKKPGQLAHFLKGHSLERWDDVPGMKPYVKCSCGETWQL